MSSAAPRCDADFRAFGLTTRPPREKVDGLEEAIQIIRGLCAQPEFSFPGRLYRTENAGLEPKPAEAEAALIVLLWVPGKGPGLACGYRELYTRI